VSILHAYNEFNNKYVHSTKFDFIDFAVPIIDYMLPTGLSNNINYNHHYFLTCLLDFFNTSYSWSKYRGAPGYPISGKYLNQIHNKSEQRNLWWNS